jgi:hypothetical protein
MLRSLQILALVSAAIFAAALIGLTIGYSWKPPAQETQQQQSAENRSKQNEGEQQEPFWQKATSDPIAAFTLWLVIFTAVLGAASIFQLASLNRSEVTSAKAAKAAQDSADTSRKALTDVQRAFVFMDSFEVEVINDTLVIMPKWKNSGNTPTRMMRNWVSYSLFETTPPAGFAYPDLGEDGEVVANSAETAPLVFVGPQASRYAHFLRLPTSLAETVRTGKKRLFVWGWTRYEDVFGVKHLSRFCNEIKMTNLPIIADDSPTIDGRPPVKVAIDFPQFGK